MCLMSISKDKGFMASNFNEYLTYFSFLVCYKNKNSSLAGLPVVFLYYFPDNRPYENVEAVRCDIFSTILDHYVFYKWAYCLTWSVE